VVRGRRSDLLTQIQGVDQRARLWVVSICACSNIMPFAAT